ncbi:MAG: hypothetical protein AAFQ74_18305 [Cyanobacteria bacterium J06623_4]
MPSSGTHPSASLFTISKSRRSKVSSSVQARSPMCAELHVLQTGVLEAEIR